MDFVSKCCRSIPGRLALPARHAFGLSMADGLGRRAGFGDITICCVKLNKLRSRVNYKTSYLELPKISDISMNSVIASTGDTARHSFLIA